MDCLTFVGRKKVEAVDVMGGKVVDLLTKGDHG
jgi:hypothetical protein